LANQRERGRAGGRAARARPEIRATPWGDAALLFCALAWGATFITARHALVAVSPLLLNTLRFGLAAAVLLPLAARRPRELLRATAWGGLLAILLTAGFALQVLGLERIGAARSAFLTAFYALFTPPLEWLVTGRRPAARIFVGTAIALAGIGVMTGVGLATPSLAGDLLTLACALVFAGQMVTLHRALDHHPPLPLATVQIAGTAIFSALLVPVSGPLRFAPTLAVLAEIGFLGLVATALLLGLQAWGQERTTPSRAGLLFSLEPVFAAAFAWLAGESMTPREIVGAALVMAGILWAIRPGADARSR